MEDLSELDLETLGMEDGSADHDTHAPFLSSFGMSVDLDELTDEQRDAYEQGYYSANPDLGDDDEEDSGNDCWD